MNGEILSIETAEKIAKLEKENERLKQENKRIFANVNDDQLLRSNAMNYAELQDYKARNEKAIEKCKNKQWETNAPWLIKFAKDVENILQGKSDE